MSIQTQKINYNRHQFPPLIITHVVWLYARLNLRLCGIEEMMLERGVDVSYETIPRRTVKFDPLLAHSYAVGSHAPAMPGIWAKSS